MKVLLAGWVKDVEVQWLWEPRDCWLGAYGSREEAFVWIDLPPVADGRVLYLTIPPFGAPLLPLKLRWGHLAAKVRRCKLGATHRLTVNERGVSGPCATCGAW